MIIKRGEIWLAELNPIRDCSSLRQLKTFESYLSQSMDYQYANKSSAQDSVRVLLARCL